MPDKEFKLFKIVVDVVDKRFKLVDNELKFVVVA